MNRQEVQQLLMMIATTYPNFKVDNKTQTIDTWLWLLEEYDANDVLTAYKSYVKSSSSGFAPSVSQLIAEIDKPKDLATIDEVTAWDMVRKAIGKSSYSSKAEYDKLPELVQRAVGSPIQLFIWATDDNYNENVVMSVFQKNFRTISQRAEQERKLPEESKLKLEELRAKNLITVDNNTLLIGQKADKLQEGDFDYSVAAEPNETIGGYAERLRQEMKW